MARGLRLLDCLRITPRFERSVNVERDIDDERLVASFTPTDAAERALDLVAKGLAANGRNVALSIAGPYGCGKSSFAQWFSALLGPRAGRAARLASSGAREHGQPAGSALAALLGKRAGAESGWLRCVVVAERGPLGRTVLRALRRGLASHPRGQTALGRRLLGNCERLLSSSGPPNSHDVLALVAQAAQLEPGLLLLIDEFGRCLEHAVVNDDASSFALLQDLAELAPAGKAPRIVLVTLSHQAFADYADGASSQMRKEWAKVQGRFSDVPYVGSTSQSLRILAQALQWTESPKSVASLARERAIDVAAVTRKSLDLSGLFGTTDRLARERMLSLYPLTPMTAIIAVELARLFGQAERSLFTFLTSAEPGGFQSLADSLVPGDVLDVHQLAEYFLLGLSGRDASRLGARSIEIWDRLREASRAGLAEPDSSILATVGLINLAGHPKVRASDEVIALAGPAVSTRTRAESLERLEEAGWLLQRGHAGEYRVWQGADFDIAGAAARARTTIGQRAEADVLAATLEGGSFVARRASVERGTFRKFSRQWVSRPSDLALMPRGYSGIVAIALDPSMTLPSSDGGGWPVVTLHPANLKALKHLALDVLSLREVLSLARREQAEAPALREITLRLREAECELENLWLHTLATNDATVRCPGVTLPKGPRAGGLSESLSRVVDVFFPDTPTIRNEILNRNELSSAGARAQRELIAAILTREDRPNLGLDTGSAPWGMYLGVLGHHRLHAPLEDVGSVWVLRPPGRDSNLRPAWRAMETFYKSTRTKARPLRELWDRLLRPPIGLPEGTVPVLLAASLQLHRGDVALFKDGAYLAQIDPEDFELLVKVPGRYTLKQIALGATREAILRAVADALNAPSKVRSGSRNRSLLEAAAPLARLVTRAVKPAVLSSSSVSATTKALARAVLDARDPEQLVFEEIPAALGLKLARKPSAGDVAEFAHRLGRALEELMGAYQALLSDIAGRTYAAFNALQSSSRSEARQRIGQRCAALAPLAIDVELRAFLTRAGDDALQESEWAQSLGTLLIGRPVDQWLDDHFNQYSVSVLAMARRIERFEATCFALLPGELRGRQAVCLTVTNVNGQEIRTVVSVLEAQQPEVVRLAADLRAHLDSVDPRQREQVLALLLSEQLACAAEASEGVEPDLKEG